MSLPQSFALKPKNNHKYLRYITEDKELYGFLKFYGDELLTPYSIFQAEMAKTADGFVNIRSIYNKKYWVGQLKNDELLIVARADEPNEDQSSSSCTLFQPFSVDDDPNAITLRHVHFKRYLSIASPTSNFCSTGSADFHRDRGDVLKVTDVESLFILPKYPTFKGDNGKYLIVQNIENELYLKFSSGDARDHMGRFESSKNSDGSARIKSMSHETYWRHDSKWILADTFDFTNRLDPQTFFFATKVGENLAALRVDKNMYCQRHITRENRARVDCLIANTSEITRHAELQVGERLLSRSIDNFEFNLLEARFHDKMHLEVASETRINDSDEDLTMEFNLHYFHPMTRTWGSSISKKIFNRFNISAKVPLPLKGKMEIVDESREDYIWGDPVITTTEESFHYTTIVPPKNKVNVRLIVTKGTMDVPFTYTQHDTLVDGQLITFDFDDGLCTVTKFLEFTCKTEFEPLGA